MKNAITYYYNIKIEEVHQNQKCYWFNYNQKLYELYKVQTINVKELLEIVNLLLKNRIPCHIPQMNILKSYTTLINNETYILLQINEKSKEHIIFNDIYSLYKISDIKKPENKKDWYTLWTSKIDYLELQLTEFGKKYPLLRKSFPYFCGLAENAIQLLEKINVTEYKINHYRIQNDEKLIDFFNPLNMLIDLKTRDISEYIKNNRKHINNINDIKYIIAKFKLNNEEIKLLFARIMFPNYYFDTFEEIIAQEKDEQEIIIHINNIESIEHLLKSIYKYIREITQIPNIEWLNN